MAVNRHIINDKVDSENVYDEIIDVKCLSLSSPTSSVSTNVINVSVSMNIHRKENIYSMKLKRIALEALIIKLESDTIMVSNMNDRVSVHTTHSLVHVSLTMHHVNKNHRLLLYVNLIILMMTATITLILKITITMKLIM